MPEARIKIVSKDYSSRAAATDIYLDEKDITHLIKDVKIYLAGNPLRWHAEITLRAKVDIDISAITEISELTGIQMALPLIPAESAMRIELPVGKN